MSIVLLPASFDNLSLRKDGSVALKFETRELDGEEITSLLGFRNTIGWLQFSQNETMEAPPKENAHLDTKSHSQRLRDVLYVLYMSEKTDRNNYKTFESFYSERMENIIELIKNKIN